MSVLRTRLQHRRTLASRGAAALIAATSAVSITLVNPPAAQAADTVTCVGRATIFAAGTTGVLFSYPLNYPGSTTADVLANKQIGSGWNMYGKVLGGLDGRMFGIKSTGMHRYRWTGTTWENGQAALLPQSAVFAPYATPAYRNKITIDERGDIYLITSTGALAQYRYDEATRTWPIYGRVIDSGWSKYDMIVASGAGVLYARTPTGDLFRYRYDSPSQRWIVRPTVRDGSGWNGFTKGVFGLGGDTLFGIRADGGLRQYRYREDTKTWVINGRALDSGWHVFSNVFGAPNACRLTASHTPAAPPTAVERFAPVAALQAPPATGATAGMMEYAYTDNIGRIQHGRHAPDEFGSVQWTAVSGDDAFSGKPALVTTAQGTVQILGHNIGSNVWSLSQTAAGAPGWQRWADLGGAMASAPTTVRLSDNSIAVFAVDAAGELWVRPQDGPTAAVLSWRKLAATGLTDTALTGRMVVTAGLDRAATIIATDTAGTLRSATYRNGVLSAWASLGGTGFTGTPAVVLMPGRFIRVFARDSSGQIMTQVQDGAGTFPATWQSLGTFTAVGAPAAILDPVLGRIVVVARGTDNEVYRVFESAQGSATWGDWMRVNAEASDPAASDPTVTPYAGSNGQSWLIVFRNTNDGVRVYERGALTTNPV